MQGKKLLQTQNAMKTILKEMRPDDHLTIISFADNVTVWQKSGDVTDWQNSGDAILSATSANVAAAVDYVDSLEAKGGTNINDALLAGIQVIQVRIFI
jgi:hypothetical protein